jgi:tight adherence protein C
MAAIAVVFLTGWRLRPPPGRIVRLASHSGRRRSRERSRPRVIAIVAAGSAGIAALALVWPPFALIALGAVVAAPSWRRRRDARRQRAAIARSLPDVIDLLVVAIGAGLTPALAVHELAVLAPAPFGPALAEVERRAGRGQRFADALAVLPERLGEPVRVLASTVASAERYGSPLAPALESLAHEARRERKRAADEAARTLPVKLCFPLVCCTLPAFVLLTIAPLVAGAIRTLRL